MQAADEYVDRIRRYFPIEMVEVKEEPLKKSTPVDRVKRLEAERIQKTLRDGEHLVLLDERGKELASEEVAKRLDSWSQRGIGSIAFVVGGPSGLDTEFLQSAAERWALSRMTLPASHRASHALRAALPRVHDPARRAVPQMSVLSPLLEAIYPPACAACGAYGREPFCALCGDALLPAGPFVIPRAIAAAAIFAFGGPIADAVYRLKYRDHPELARPLGKQMQVGLTALPRVDLAVPGTVDRTPDHPPRLQPGARAGASCRTAAPRARVDASGGAAAGGARAEGAAREPGRRLRARAGFGPRSRGALDR